MMLRFLDNIKGGEMKIISNIGGVMAYKDYTKEQLIKKFGKSKKHLYVYKKYDYETHEYIYELRSVKNKPHENHTTIDEILSEEVA